MDKRSVNLAAALPALGSDLVIQERPIPSPGPEEITIRNHVISLNPVDNKAQTYGIMVSSFPAILGLDVSGIVVAVGSSVTRFKPGDRVFGICASWATGNPDHAAYQTYTTLGVRSAATLPAFMSFNEGATLGIAANTAVMALYDALELPLPATSSLNTRPGPPRSMSSKPLSILIWGGASSCGSMMIQFARMAGLTVFTTASARHHDYLRSLGADVLVDYNSPTAVDELLDVAEKTGARIAHAVDAISIAETLGPVMQVLSRVVGKEGASARLAHTTSWPSGMTCLTGITRQRVAGQDVWGRRRDLGDWLFNQHLDEWLVQRRVVPFKYRVVKGGLAGLQDALDQLKKGVSGEKLEVEVSPV